MRIFLSGRYARQPELRAVAACLVHMGHTVTSGWLHSDAQRSDEREAAEAIARRNWADLVASDCVACFTDEPLTPQLGGDRHVEYGIALVLQTWRQQMGVAMPVCTVGPRQLTFHSLPGVPNYPTIDQFLLWARMASEGV